MNASASDATESAAKSVLLGFVDPRLAFVFPDETKGWSFHCASIRRNSRFTVKNRTNKAIGIEPRPGKHFFEKQKSIPPRMRSSFK